MKITIGTDDLRSCLKKFEAIQQPYCYQSESVSLTANKNTCTVSITDGLISVVVVLPCHVETPGNVTVNYKKLLELLSV
ncbi:MAG: hypothetical protein ACKPE3_40950, partial [Sphaerospermopsis kisseleviana]